MALSKRLTHPMTWASIRWMSSTEVRKYHTLHLPSRHSRLVVQTVARSRKVSNKSCLLVKSIASLWMPRTLAMALSPAASVLHREGQFFFQLSKTNPLVSMFYYLVTWTLISRTMEMALSAFITLSRTRASIHLASSSADNPFLKAFTTLP